MYLVLLKVFKKVIFFLKNQQNDKVKKTMLATVATLIKITVLEFDE